MTAPTVPTAPLPSELQSAISYIEECVLHSHNSRMHWQTVKAALLTMQRERDGHRDAEIELRNDLQNECATSRELREQLAASERTCAEHWEALLKWKRRAEAAERTVANWREAMRQLGETNEYELDQVEQRATELARLEGEGGK
jgi:Lon protease-like protein